MFFYLGVSNVRRCLLYDKNQHKNICENA